MTTEVDTTRRLPVRVLYNDAVMDPTSRARIPGRRWSELSDTERQMVVPASADSRRPYLPGDPLLEVWVTTSPFAGHSDAAKVAEVVLEQTFRRLNIDHPDDWTQRSMSVGDVIVVGETAWLCGAAGWSAVDIARSPIATA